MGTLTTIRASRTCTLDSFDRCITVEQVPGPSRLAVDLTRARFLDPYAIVVVACAVDTASRGGDGITFTPPDPFAGVNAATYLRRARLHQVLEAAGVEDHGLPAVGEWDVTGRMQELQRFTDDAGADQLGGMIHTAMYDQEGVKEGLAKTISAAVWEGTNNAVEHSEAPCGYLAAQLYRPSWKDPHIVFAVGDAGIGVRGALSRVMDLDDDAQALAEALKRGVTSTDDERGVGLPRTCEAITGFGGTFALRSGEARLKVQRAGSRSHPVSHLPGTILAGSISCAHQLVDRSRRDEW